MNDAKNDANNSTSENQVELENEPLIDSQISQTNMDLEQENKEKPNESISSDIPVILKAVPIEEASKDKEIKQIEKKNKKKLLRISMPTKWVFILGIVLVLIGLILQFIPKNNQSINEKAEAKDFAGIYKNNKGKAYLYAKNNKEVTVAIELDNYSFMNQEEVKDGKLTMKTTENKTTITLSKDKKTIFVVSDFKELNNISFKKEKDYTKEDFFQNNYGDLKLFNNEYNGIYRFNDKEIRLYQKDLETIRGYIEENDSSMDIEFKKKEDNILEGEILEDKYKITLKDNSITFETINGEEEFDGTYEKVGKQTIEDIINSYF